MKQQMLEKEIKHLEEVIRVQKDVIQNLLVKLEILAEGGDRSESVRREVLNGML